MLIVPPTRTASRSGYGESPDRCRRRATGTCATAGGWPKRGVTL